MKILLKADPFLGPEEWFTGTVDLQPLKGVSENSKLTMSSVHFSAGARSAWHSHPYGQTLYVTEGVGLVQKRGEPIRIIHPGDVVWTEPGEEHWHGASAHTDMTHLAIQEVDDPKTFAIWGDKVTDQEYFQQSDA